MSQTPTQTKQDHIYGMALYVLSLLRKTSYEHIFNPQVKEIWEKSPFKQGEYTFNRTIDEDGRLRLTDNKTGLSGTFDVLVYNATPLQADSLANFAAKAALKCDEDLPEEAKTILEEARPLIINEFFHHITTASIGLMPDGLLDLWARRIVLTAMEEQNELEEKSDNESN